MVSQTNLIKEFGVYAPNLVSKELVSVITTLTQVHAKFWLPDLN